jgi:hypothetical protein
MKRGGWQQQKINVGDSKIKSLIFSLVRKLPGCTMVRPDDHAVF